MFLHEEEDSLSPCPSFTHLVHKAVDYISMKLWPASLHIPQLPQIINGAKPSEHCASEAVFSVAPLTL